MEDLEQVLKLLELLTWTERLFGGWTVELFMASYHKGVVLLEGGGEKCYTIKKKDK